MSTDRTKTWTAVAEKVYVTYKVVFTVYQYNTGAADNGHYKKGESFKTLDEAYDFAKQVIRLAKNNNTVENRNFAERYCLSGYVARYDGIIKITEEQVDE